MGVGGKKKKKCSRKVKSAIHVNETVLDATVEDKRVVSTYGVERMFVHPARYRAYTCKVKTYSSLKVLKWVRNLLSPSEQEKFMSNTIGPLLHLPMQTWSGALFHSLLASQISTGDEGDKGNREEMRVMVCGKELSFGKKEFALISGLSFRKSDHNFSRPATKPCLKMKHFPDEGKPVTGKIPLESDDKVKFSLLYVVHRYVLGKGDDKVVEHDHWYLVDNLVDFNSYLWAEIAFSRTIDNSNSALDYQINANKPVGSEVTYKSQGMAHVLVVWGLEVLPKVLDNFGSKTNFANWRPHMHSVTCDLVIHHEPLLTILEESKGEVCDDIMWHKEDAKRLVMLGLCEGPLVDDEEEVSLKNENVVENEDLFEKGEEENMLESENVFVDEQVPEESSMDDEKDEEDLLGNENVVEEKYLFEKDEEEARVAHPRSQLDVLCSRTSTSVIASFESFVKNAMIGHTEDLQMTVIGEMEVFKSAVKGQLEELSVQVSNSHKTMLNHVECLTAEIKSIKDKIGGTKTYNALSKTKTGTPPGGHNEEGNFDGAEMQKPDVTPGNGSNNIELNPPYPYNPPNKEVDVSRDVVKNICNSSTGKKRKRQKNKPCTGPSAPIIVLSDDVTKGQGWARRKINPAPSLLPPYTPIGKVAKKNAKKVSTSEEPVIMNYFEEDTLDQQITKQDIDDVNRFINLGERFDPCFMASNNDGDGGNRSNGDVRESAAMLGQIANTQAQMIKSIDTYNPSSVHPSERLGSNSCNIRNRDDKNSYDPSSVHPSDRLQSHSCNI
ncbi:hypothetical protein C5167_048482 [Papaver somniferum]|uniref:DUF1985 domain-containing protein n=1 Tax=Papaver somniferum TaxID=3469 RepID=A0A4Y7KLF1_PAPSO|nr:hypothetical protein C5167_048482 [Papaver somniferum]